MLALRFRRSLSIGKIPDRMDCCWVMKDTKRPMLVKIMVGGMKVRNILMPMIMVSGTIFANLKNFQHTFKVFEKVKNYKKENQNPD